jgi:ubiquinone biosynthesis protein
LGLLNLLQHRDQLGRLLEIVRILARYGLADWLKTIPREEIRSLIASKETRALANRSREERIRLALTDLGPAFVKLGQVLSTRPDLVGVAVARELQHLQAGTPPDPPEMVRQTIQAELGQTPEELFAEFEPTAMASASIGQVHRARLHDGKAAVVKVQHAGIQDRVRIDLEMLMALAEWLQENVPDARAYRPVATAREFQRTLMRELDFSSERRNLEQFARNFAEDATVHVPAVFPQLCSRRVLTMEMLIGIEGKDIDEMRKARVDLNEFARRSATMYLNMIIRDGFYHADPHPGNFMVLHGCVVGVLDCGMVGRLDDSLREVFEDMLLYLLRGDSEGLAELLMRAGSAPPEVDRSAFRADVSDFFIEYGGQSVKELDLGGALERLTEIVRRHHVLLPSSMSLLLKTLIMLDGTARTLSPDFSLVELLETYKTRLIRDRLMPGRWLLKLQRGYRDIDRLLTHGPRDLGDILERVRAGNLEIKHEHHRLEITVNRLVAGLLTAALFLGSSLVLSHKVQPTIYDVSVFGVLGCSASLVLGAYLYRVVSRNLS